MPTNQYVPRRRYRLLYNASNLPGTAKQVLNTLANNGLNVRRCYIGEVIPFLAEVPVPSRGIITFHGSDRTTLSNDEFLRGIKSDCSTAISSFYADEVGLSLEAQSIDVTALEVDRGNVFRFAIQLEIANYPGIMNDILKAFWEEIDNTAYPLNVDQIISFPIYHLLYGGNRSIVDIRCSFQGDLFDYTEKSVRKLFAQEVIDRLVEKLRKTVGVRSGCLKATHPGGKPSTFRTRILDEQMASNPDAYRIEYSGLNVPGTALAVTESIAKFGLNIRRAYVGDNDFANIKLRKTVFKVELQKRVVDYLAPEDFCLIVKQEISDAIVKHQTEKMGVSIPDATTTPNVEMKPILRRSGFHISCQIESSDEIGFLNDLAGLMVSQKNPSEYRFNIDQLIHIERFTNSGQDSLGKTALTDLKFSLFGGDSLQLLKDPELTADKEQMARHVCEWFVRNISDLGSIHWVIVKSVEPDLPASFYSVDN